MERFYEISSQLLESYGVDEMICRVFGSSYDCDFSEDFEL